MDSNERLRACCHVVQRDFCQDDRPEDFDLAKTTDPVASSLPSATPHTCGTESLAGQVQHHTEEGEEDTCHTYPGVGLFCRNQLVEGQERAACCLKAPAHAEGTELPKIHQVAA